MKRTKHGLRAAVEVMGNNQIKVNLLFPTAVYCVDNFLCPQDYTHLKNHLTRKPMVNGDAGWNADCSTTFGKQQIKDDDQLSFILDLVITEAQRFSAYLQTKPVLTCTNSWLNYYKPGNYQEWHLHCNSYFSAIYIVEAQYKEDVILFENPSVGALTQTINPIEQNSVNQNYSDYYSENNRLIIFRSFVKHMIPRTKGTRQTMSFNIDAKESA